MIQGTDTAKETRVLVVDDEPLLLRHNSALLSEAGYQVLEAATGREALLLATESRPELVLLDVMLPDMDGLEVCRRIKSDPLLVDTFVALLSSRRTESANQAQGLEEGADEYIVRPASDRELRTGRLEAGRQSCAVPTSRGH